MNSLGGRYGSDAYSGPHTLHILPGSAFATAFVNGASTDPTVTNLTWSTYNGTGTFANNTTATALTTTTYKATTVDHNATPPGADLVLTATALNGCKASDTMHLDIRITYTW